MNTPIKITELDRLEAAASARPWTASAHDVFDGNGDLTCDWCAEVEDADLIAATRNALPALLRLARAAKAYRDESHRTPAVADEMHAALAAFDFEEPSA